jgi:hypothetical protein
VAIPAATVVVVDVATDAVAAGWNVDNGELVDDDMGCFLELCLSVLPFAGGGAAQDLCCCSAS